jgi:nucleotide-binding universal stress UspA family protein
MISVSTIVVGIATSAFCDFHLRVTSREAARADSPEVEALRLCCDDWPGRSFNNVNGESATASGSSDAVYPVVVGVDGSAGAIRAARWAAAVAEGFAVPLQIVLAENSAQRQSAEAVLRSAEDAVRTHFKALDVTSAVVEGSAGQTLIDLSVAARLIVIGNSDSQTKPTLLVGSMAMTVAAHAACPVVVWHGDTVAPTRQPVVVGIDHDRDSRVAITAAFEFVDRLALKLIAVHAWSTRGSTRDDALSSVMFWSQAESTARQYLSTTLMPWIDLYPNVEVAQVVDSDKVSRALLRCAEGAQLLVVGSRASTPLAGNVSSPIGLELLTNATVPVMFCHSVDTHG